MPSGKRWLVTFLGLEPRPIRYELDGHTAQAPHATLALLKLLGDEAPSTVRVLATRESVERTWPDLAAAFAEAASDVACRELAAVDDLDGFLSALVSLVSERAQDAPLELVLDLTHGFRHLPMLAYAGALYLAALRPEVRVVGCWYGMLQGERGRFLDLLPLLELPEWLHALRLLEERSDGTRLAALLERALDNEGDADHDVRKCAEDVQKFALTLAWRCPLDVAAAAQVFAGSQKPLRRALRRARIAGADQVAGRLFDLVGRYAVSAASSKKGKPSVNKETLRLHAAMIDAAFGRDDLPGAVGLLREWLVSWVWWVEHAEYRLGPDGLDREERQKASDLLGALATLEGDPSLSGLLDSSQRQIGAFWRRLSEVRNALAHSGMRRQPVLNLRDRADELRREWGTWVKALLDGRGVVLQPTGREGVLLVSPLGNRPAVLAAALDCCEPQPDRLLVVTSADGRDKWPDVANGRLPAESVRLVVFEDPHRGVDELDAVVEQGRAEVARAKQVRVNLTGGTTLLGLAAERIAREAERLEAPVRRFVLVEPAEHSELSSLVWVDEAERV
jgi:CRISPR-associated DxTHG motif protein